MWSVLQTKLKAMGMPIAKPKPATEQACLMRPQQQ